MTDSNSGIVTAQMPGVFVLPMPVIIENRVFFENIDITPEEFYRKQQAGVRTSTSQPSPAALMGMWDQLLESHDEIVYIPMSSGLSSSCQTAMALAADYGDRVQVVNNGRISVTQLLSVKEAVAMADRGCGAKEIKAELEAYGGDASIYITVDTLEYLKKSGRVTPAAAAIGTVLNIKPILSLQQDKLEAYAKVRGRKAAFQRMMEALQHNLDTKLYSADQDGRIVLGMAATQMPEDERKYWPDIFQGRFPRHQIVYAPLTLSIGAHTSAGALGIGAIRYVAGDL